MAKDLAWSYRPPVFPFLFDSELAQICVMEVSESAFTDLSPQRSSLTDSEVTLCSTLVLSMFLISFSSALQLLLGNKKHFLKSLPNEKVDLLGMGVGEGMFGCHL